MRCLTAFREKIIDGIRLHRNSQTGQHFIHVRESSYLLVDEAALPRGEPRICHWSAQGCVTLYRTLPVREVQGSRIIFEPPNRHEDRDDLLVLAQLSYRAASFDNGCGQPDWRRSWVAPNTYTSRLWDSQFQHIVENRDGKPYRAHKNHCLLATMRPGDHIDMILSLTGANDKRLDLGISGPVLFCPSRGKLEWQKLSPRHGC
jgi:hypothetical protein